MEKRASSVHRWRESARCAPPVAASPRLALQPLPLLCLTRGSQVAIHRPHSVHMMGGPGRPARSPRSPGACSCPSALSRFAVTVQSSHPPCMGGRARGSTAAEVVVEAWAKRTFVRRTYSTRAHALLFTRSRDLDVRRTCSTSGSLASTRLPMKASRCLSSLLSYRDLSLCS